MSDDASTQSAFSLEYEEQELAEGLPFSRLAIVAALLAASSFTAVLHPFLVITSLLAVVFSVLSIRSCTRPGEEMAGRQLAVVSLFFALLFGTFGLTREFVRARWYFEKAAVLGQHYFAVLGEGTEDSFQRAHQLTLYPRSRAKASEPLTRFYAEVREQATVGEDDAAEQAMAQAMRQADNGSMHDQFKTYCNGPVQQKLMGPGHEPRTTLLRNVSVDVSRLKTTVRQVYRIVYNDNGSPQTLDVEARLERVFDLGTYTWRVAGVKRL